MIRIQLFLSKVITLAWDPKLAVVKGLACKLYYMYSGIVHYRPYWDSIVTCYKEVTCQYRKDHTHVLLLQYLVKDTKSHINAFKLYIYIYIYIYICIVCEFRLHHCAIFTCVFVE